MFIYIEYNIRTLFVFCKLALMLLDFYYAHNRWGYPSKCQWPVKTFIKKKIIKNFIYQYGNAVNIYLYKYKHYCIRKMHVYTFNSRQCTIKRNHFILGAKNNLFIFFLYNQLTLTIMCTWYSGTYHKFFLLVKNFVIHWFKNHFTTNTRYRYVI